MFELLLICISFLLICANISNINAFNLMLIHNNDLHSRIAQVNKYNSPCDHNSMKQGNCYGGVARIASKVNEIRARHQQNTLFLNGGDSFQGTVWYSLYKWRIAAHFTNLLKYDAMAIGNHEFDDGVEGYAPFVDETMANIPTVCCNIDVTNEPKLKGKIKKSIVVEVNNKKIGIIGYLTPETSFLSKPGNTIKFTDEIQCIREEVKQMKSQGINIIIGLGHSGYVKDQEIAKNVPELDVIIGGHSHTLLYSGPKPREEVQKVMGEYPTIVNHGTHKTLILQAYAFSRYLGLIDIEFDDNGNVYRYDGQPFLLDSSVTEDPEIAEDVRKYEKILTEEFGKVIGKTNVFLEGGESCGLDECNLGNLFCEASVEYLMKNRPRYVTEWTPAAVCVANGGGIRTSIDALQRDGNITIQDLLAVFPFNNNMITLVLTGKVIMDMLNYNLIGHDPHLTIRNNKFLQMSGMRVEYNLTKPDYQRINKVLIRCSQCLVPDYTPLIETEEYKVIMPQYISNGGDGYHMLTNKNIQRIQNEVLDFKILQDYIEQRTVIYTGNDKRINFVF